jgi:hypothetical protein
MLAENNRLSDLIGIFAPLTFVLTIILSKYIYIILSGCGIVSIICGGKKQKSIVGPNLLGYPALGRSAD